ncbi:MAG: metalloregulator ArsR/SmtB family transcription factor [Pseudomonadota bacterium]
MDSHNRQALADLLKALGEYNRLSLVYRLCGCSLPQNAMCLCDCCSVDSSVVSRHLKVLAQEGVVQMEKRGRERIYSLNRGAVAKQLRALADEIEGRGTNPGNHSAEGETHERRQVQV